MRRSLLTGLFLIFLFTLIFAQPSFAKDYSFDSVKIDAYIGPNGSFDFAERRTYDFEGEYHWADYTVLKQGAKDITSFAISDDKGLKYKNSTSETAGTFFVTNAQEELYSKWFYSAKDEKKTFVISFKVDRAIKAYEDYAQLYWKFIGSDWKKSTALVEIAVHLPPGAEKNQIRAWGHGPLNGEVKILSGKEVTLRVTSLPPNTFVEGRILFPSALVPNAQKVDSEIGPKVISEEEGFARSANLKRTYLRAAFAATLILPLLGLLVGFILWLLYGKEYKASFEGEYFRELPADYPPAILGYLWHFGKVTTTDFASTLMDLARRGYLKIEEVVSESEGFLGKKREVDHRLTTTQKDTGNLEEFEQSLLYFVFSTVSVDGVNTTFEEVKDYAKANKVEFQKYYKEWQELVEKAADPRGFIDKRSTGKMYLNGAIGVLMIVIGVFSIAYGVFTGVFAIFVGLIQIFLSALIKRRSQAGAEDLAKWQAFRNFLYHFSNLKEAVPESMAIWEHYLVYAVTLGVAKKVIDQLKIVFPQYGDPENPSYYYGPVWFHSSSGLDGLSGLSDLSEGFASVASTASSTMSSGSGGGGGFSGNGGGGGGGGGGGAG